MPLESAEAIVLGSQVFHDQDKLVQILTSGDGIIKVVAPGSSKGKNRFGSLLELFTVGEFYFYRKEDRELATLSKGEVTTSFFETVSEPGRIFHFYLIAEIILKFVPQNFNSKRVFKLLNSILVNSSEGADIKKLLLYFMVWILRIEGLMFDPGRCCKCNVRGLSKVWVKKDFRGVVCKKCREGEELSFGKSGIGFIEWTLRNGAEDLDKIGNGGIYEEMFMILKEKIEYHGEFSLNSSRYLTEFR